jgi:redox-sensitive bicupin YhaK (pirin superfamily)
MHFGALRVINDDRIKAGSGFEPHSHQDMEIITYVRSGAILHRDSLGNEGRTNAGDVQVMSAGTGITHAEFADPDQETTLFQIWIYPHTKRVAPRWQTRAFPKETVTDHLPLLVSGDQAEIAAGALPIYQHARLYGGRLAPHQRLEHRSGRLAYVVASMGDVMVSDQAMRMGDGLEAVDAPMLSMAAGEAGAEVLVIEVPER